MDAEDRQKIERLIAGRDHAHRRLPQEWHIHQALLCGATQAKVREAIDVGIEMGGGPATVSARFALRVLEYYG